MIGQALERLAASKLGEYRNNLSCDSMHELTIIPSSEFVQATANYLKMNPLNLQATQDRGRCPPTRQALERPACMMAVNPTMSTPPMGSQMPMLPTPIGMGQMLGLYLSGPRQMTPGVSELMGEMMPTPPGLVMRQMTPGPSGMGEMMPAPPGLMMPEPMIMEGACMGFNPNLFGAPKLRAMLTPQQPFTQQNFAAVQPTRSAPSPPVRSPHVRPVPSPQFPWEPVRASGLKEDDSLERILQGAWDHLFPAITPLETRTVSTQTDCICGSM